MAEVLTFVLLGLSAGSVYGLAGTGLVLTYTTSGVFNLAYGAVGALGAFVFFDLVDLGVPWPIAFAACTLLGGGIAGLVLEPLMRSLAATSVHLRIVSTVGLMLFVQGLITWHWGTEPRFVTSFLPTGSLELAGARLGVDRLIVLAAGASTTLGLAVWLRSSLTGVALRAVVDDPVLLAETGRSPLGVRRVAWCAGSSFSVASGILLAPTIGLEAVLLTFVVVQAFGAAAVGAFRDLRLTYVGGLMIGVVASLAARYVGTHEGWLGLPSAVPFLALYVALVVRPARQDRVSLRPPLPVRGRQTAAIATAAVVVLVALSLRYPGRMPIFTAAAALAVIFMGLALLVNLAGQVSLGHAALAAVGAVTMARFATESPLAWVVALVVAGGVAAVVGFVAALPSLRLAGLPLALATFAFGLAMARVFYPTSAMFGATGEIDAARADFAGLGSDRGHFFVALGVAAVAAIVLHRVDRGAFGRLLRGMADHSDGVAALGVSPLLLRAVAFAIASFFAGVGGALLATTNETASAAAFEPSHSLLWIAVLAIGGSGVVAAGIRGALAAALIPYFLEPFIGGDELLVLFGLGAMIAAAARGRVGRRVIAGRLVRFGERAAVDAEWRLARSPVAARLEAR